MSKKWYTDGKKQVLAETCPIGFKPGRLPVSEETRKKHSQNNAWKTMTEEQKKARAEKISKTINGRTEEEKLLFSEHVSKARTGKGLSRKPWNKGLKGVQKAWNKGIPCPEDIKEKISKTKQEKSEEEKALIEAKRKASRGNYGPSWNKGIPMTEERKEHLHEYWENISKEEKDNILQKQYKTKTENGTFKNLSSLPEKRFGAALKNKFGEESVCIEYVDELRYNHRCDFYIKPLDLFIELNIEWTHGGHPFNSNNEKDISTLNIWKEKSKFSTFYANAIKTWTVSDVEKLADFRKNNLNYKIFYTEEEAMRWIRDEEF